MNYEQKYKEALERAQRLSIDGFLDAVAISDIFPELNESERIRKSIIAILDNYIDNSNTVKSELLAWLEKQGEQKPTWKPTEAQLIVIKDLIEDKNTSNVNKVILRGMFDEFKQYFGL